MIKYRKPNGNRITFYLPEEPNLNQLVALDPDEHWNRLLRGQRWTIQSFVRLRDNGNPVEISNTLPESGIVIYHQRHKRLLKKALTREQYKKLVLVCMRADKSESLLSDFEMLQNDKWADNQRFFYVPYWPQPGLIPRNPARENRLEVVSYKGFHTNLNAYFLEPEWENWLKDRGCKWQLDSEDFYVSEESGVSVNWHDYREVDVVVALRKPPTRADQKNGYTAKPATKLYNAWLAGVPAILGNEYAFRQIRRSDLDYLEAETVDQVKEALLYLKNNPHRYRAIVENGKRRAVEFTVNEIRKKWETFLFSTLPKAIESSRLKRRKAMPHEFNILLRRLDRVWTGRTKR